MDNNIFEENKKLKENIVKLENELKEFKQNTEKQIFKNKIKEFITQIENNSIKDINKELYLYINNIKNDFEKQVKDNIILQLCDFLLNDSELYHINDSKLIIDKLNKLTNLI
jgi:hypothetical protein